MDRLATLRAAVKAAAQEQSRHLSEMEIEREIYRAVSELRAEWASRELERAS
jgi:hypothetical protein